MAKRPRDLYPADYFIALRLPANVRLALSKVS